MKINVDRDESKRENYVYSHQAVTFSLLLSKAATRGVLRNFAKFTGKHPCQSLFFNKVAGAGFFCRTPLDDCLFCVDSKMLFLFMF